MTQHEHPSPRPCLLHTTSAEPGSASDADAARPITLTTIGSRGVELEVSPAALTEASGGITLWSRYLPGTPMEQRHAYTLTAEQAKGLITAIAAVIDRSNPRKPRPEPPSR
jgi:hypothetical protein